ncbi:hypothetical protein DL98DRAFT_657248 [Cadophora sp. DSE1049]|nr:hypothetical protein DL98DRAFT_657248 [Cadophora sp. DSE1049]
MASIVESPRHLLLIPQELRDKILGFALPVMKTAQTSWDNSDGRRKKDGSNSSFQSGRCKYEDKDMDQPSDIPTLAVSRQLRDETLKLMEHLGLPGKRSYRLDVMLVEEDYLWPTWLYVPSLTRQVDEVVATIRICGIAGANSRSGFSSGCGGPPLITWAFWNLLQCFLAGGPLARDTKDDIGVSVKSLVIDIRTPDVPAEMVAPETTVIEGEKYRHFLHGGYRGLVNFRQKTGIPYVMNPKNLIMFLVHEMDSLLGMSYHTASYGAILYERIGSIKFTLDGELCKEFDLAEGLANIRFRDSFGNVPREERPAVFNAWKENAYKSREEFGLKTIPQTL